MCLWPTADETAKCLLCFLASLLPAKIVGLALCCLWSIAEAIHVPRAAIETLQRCKCTLSEAQCHLKCCLTLAPGGGHAEAELCRVPRTKGCTRGAGGAAEGAGAPGAAARAALAAQLPGDFQAGGGGVPQRRQAHRGAVQRAAGMPSFLSLWQHLLAITLLSFTAHVSAHTPSRTRNRHANTSPACLSTAHIQ